MSSLDSHVRTCRRHLLILLTCFVASCIACIVTGFSGFVPLILVVFVFAAIALYVVFYEPRAVFIEVLEDGYRISVATLAAMVSFEAPEIVLSDARIVGMPVMGIRFGSEILGVFECTLGGKVICFAKRGIGILARVGVDLSVFIGVEDLDALLKCLEGEERICAL